MSGTSLEVVAHQPHLSARGRSGGQNVESVEKGMRIADRGELTSGVPEVAVDLGVLLQGRANETGQRTRLLQTLRASWTPSVGPSGISRCCSASSVSSDTIRKTPSESDSSRSSRKCVMSRRHAMWRWSQRVLHLMSPEWNSNRKSSSLPVAGAASELPWPVVSQRRAPPLSSSPT